MIINNNDKKAKSMIIYEELNKMNRLEIQKNMSGFRARNCQLYYHAIQLCYSYYRITWQMQNLNQQHN